MSNNEEARAGCAQLNSRGRWCQASVVNDRNVCVHHDGRPVRYWSSDRYRVADVIENERRRSA